MRSRGEAESQQPPVSAATKDLLRGCSEKVGGGSRNRKILGEWPDSKRGSGKTRQVSSSHTAPPPSVSQSGTIAETRVDHGSHPSCCGGEADLGPLRSLSQPQGKNIA